jgi:hypothetical protein
LRKKKTVETVPLSFWPVITGLKPGVNEKIGLLRNLSLEDFTVA